MYQITYTFNNDNKMSKYMYNSIVDYVDKLIIVHHIPLKIEKSCTKNAFTVSADDIETFRYHFRNLFRDEFLMTNISMLLEHGVFEYRECYAEGDEGVVDTEMWCEFLKTL